MSGPNERDEIAAVLAGHQRKLDGPGSCLCGNWPPLDHSVSWPDHLADALTDVLAERDRRTAVKALRRFADSRGVNVGDEDDDYWRGYRQAQRECLHDAINTADRIERGE